MMSPSPLELHVPHHTETISVDLTNNTIVRLISSSKRSAKRAKHTQDVASGTRIWRGGVVLARCVVKYLHKSAPSSSKMSLLELGAGGGICSLGALLTGLVQSVTITDCDLAALDSCRRNIRLNFESESNEEKSSSPSDLELEINKWVWTTATEQEVQVCQHQWEWDECESSGEKDDVGDTNAAKKDPNDQEEGQRMGCPPRMCPKIKFFLIAAADCLYSSKQVRPLVTTLRRRLHLDGVALLSFVDRGSLTLRTDLIHALDDVGLILSSEFVPLMDEDAQDPRNRNQKKDHWYSCPWYETERAGAVSIWEIRHCGR